MLAGLVLRRCGLCQPLYVLRAETLQGLAYLLQRQILLFQTLDEC
jgi:hypothetical protein